MNLTEWLLECVERDQVGATMREWHTLECHQVPQFGSDYTYPCNCGAPERMAAEAAAKLAIIAQHAPFEHDGQLWCRICVDPQGFGQSKSHLGTLYPCATLQALASIYEDR